MAIGPKFPPHLSLLSIAKANVMETNFYYGGNSNFDGLDVFMQYQSISNI
jgi:hypothetical protein